MLHLERTVQRSRCAPWRDLPLVVQLRCTRRPGRDARCGASADFKKFADKAYLDEAAKRYRVGMENGLREDELVAMELGANALADLTEVQQQYVEKVKEKLAKRAAELAEEERRRKEREARYLELGKALYERGEYSECVTALERAVEDLGRTSLLGGEAQMWLALGYQAVGRETECIDLYKWLEENHPVKKVKKQAAELRYILEAPRLELSPDERVTIPLIQSETWRRDARKTTFQPRSLPAPKPASKKQKSYWDQDWEMPQLIPNTWYYRVAWLALVVGLAVYYRYTTAGW